MNLLVNRDGRHMGPYSFDQACQLLAEGKLHSWDLCWPDGYREWVTLDTVPGMSDKSFALREQRRAEALAAAQAASLAGPSSPNPQFVAEPKGAAQPAVVAAEQLGAATSRNWMRVVVWSSLVVVILASVFVWMKFLNTKTLIENLVHREDNLTYVKVENEPFTGTAYAYFMDGTPWEELNFENGQREGSRTIWHINGKVALQETYFAGVLQKAVSFDFNGLQDRENYENGYGTIMLYWNTSGLRAQELKYQNHVLVKRTMWAQDGSLLAVIPPEETTELPPGMGATLPPEAIAPVTPPPTQPTTPTNEPFTIPVVPAIDTTPDHNKRGRLKKWVQGNTESTLSRIAVDRRIDLIFQNSTTNTLLKEFGYPDQITGNWWSYGNMIVRNIELGGTSKNVHFLVFNSRVMKIQCTK
jgi:hypothetical protein